MIQSGFGVTDLRTARREPNDKAHLPGPLLGVMSREPQNGPRSGAAPGSA
jgi:hypothetical protein